MNKICLSFLFFCVLFHLTGCLPAYRHIDKRPHYYGLKNTIQAVLIVAASWVVAEKTF